ncbi:MAG: redoxin domain-containing protein [Gammaproteobacteria bacterium]
MSIARFFLFALLSLSAVYTGSASAQAVEPLLALDEPVAAPAFTLPDAQGQSHSLADYQGKVLVVNFWATWCPPCIHEMPALQNLRTTLQARGLEVIGINMGETQDDITRFTDRLSVDFPLLLDENLVATMAWQVQNLPTTFVVNRDGMIVYSEVGDKPWDDPVILQQIEALLNN